MEFPKISEGFLQKFAYLCHLLEDSLRFLRVILKQPLRNLLSFEISRKII